MCLFKIDDEVRLYNRPLGKVPVLSDAVLLAENMEATREGR
jgi:hypothetical protein